MLPDKDAMATIAVKNLANARKFYQGTLGFSPTAETPDVFVTYRSGGSTLLVYQSEFGGTNKATSATWGVGTDFDALMKTLQKASVPFEHYDFPGMTRDGDVHVMGDFKAAWFRDPDGNILHINNQ